MPEPIVVDTTKPADVVVTPPAADTTVVTPEVDPLIEKDKEIARLQDLVHNYKTVALKRFGKLPGDQDFMKGADETTGLTVEETVKQTLIANEIARLEREKNDEVRKIQRENSELKLAIKNRPNTGSTGGNDGGASVEVKDNVFSPAQIEQLTAKAIRLKADPAKFIERAKKNFAARG